MSNASRPIFYVKLAVVAVCAAVFAVGGFYKFSPSYYHASASAFGPSPSFTGATGESSCVACHSGNPVNDGSGSVAITGLPASYSPNQTITLTVTTSRSDAVIYGFQLTAIDSLGRRVGTFTLPQQNPVQIQEVFGNVGGNTRSYIEHTVDGIVPTQFGSKSWTFTWKAPAQGAGTVRFFAAGNAANSDGNTSGDFIYTTSKTVADSTAPQQRALFDFDGDGKADISVFRPTGGFWYLQQSQSGFTGVQFGVSTDKLVPADYDGDGKTDVAVYRGGAWYIQRSQLGFTSVSFGDVNDIPAPADYDNDGKADVAVFRPSNGTWYLQQSTAGFAGIAFGANGDKPVAADYDGDGKADIAVFRNGVWYIQRSQLGFFSFAFGDAADKLVPADYDGDGKADIAVFRPSNGVWYLQRSQAGFTSVAFGLGTDIPVPADYDGDAKADVAVFRASAGAWYIQRSQAGFLGYSFGASTDLPVENAYVR